MYGESNNRPGAGEIIKFAREAAEYGVEPDKRRAVVLMLSLHHRVSKDATQSMEISARLSSKGQVTVPRAVREALSLEEGDRLVFRVEGHRAVLARTPDLLALAGSVEVPAAKRGTPWAEVRRQTRAARVASRR